MRRLYPGIAGLAFVLACLFSGCAPKDVQLPRQPARIAVVLGAGASRGFAHIGVLKVLETNGVPVHLVVGTSAGSFVGSLYAYGYSAFQIQKMALEIEKSDIVDLVVPDNGFVKGERLEEYVNRLVNYTPMEKFRTPFYAVATDLSNGSEVVFGKGNTGVAVRASCAIPGIFRPVRIENRLYVDGGVVSPVAAEAARRFGADVVIAVDIAASLEQGQPEGTVDTILQSIGIMYAKLASAQLTKADIVIRPRVGYIAANDFTKRHEAVLEGEKAAVEALPALRAVIAKLRQEGRLD